MAARTDMRSFPERMGMAGVGMGPERRSPVSAHSLLGSRKFLINEENIPGHTRHLRRAGEKEVTQ